MFQFDAARNAVGELVSAALTGEGWEPALESLARASGAGGATILRLRDCQPLASLSSSDWAESDAALLAGRAPPSPRQFFPDQAFAGGFVVDADLYREEDLSRDPYYQEFLRPRGVFWHAKARLLNEAGERVSISLKRRLELGPYNREDVVALDALLPGLTAAMRIGRRVLDAEASGLARAIHRRGEAVIELDAWGRVLRLHTDNRRLPGIALRDGYLTMKDARRQPALERALRGVLREPWRAEALMVTEAERARTILQLVPVSGHARDIFATTAALAVFIDLRRPPKPRGNAQAMGGAFGLTWREAEVAMLVARGTSLAEIASQLRVTIGTVRNHLKSLFEKTGTNRQGELVALLSRLNL